MAETTIFHIMRRATDFKIVPLSPLPERHVFPAGYIAFGGSAARGDHRQWHAQADALDAGENVDTEFTADQLREKADKLNLDPFFTMEGTDIIFDMVDGPVTYRFTGFAIKDDGEPDTGQMVYELVR
jgi:hypothetical protein